MKATLTGASGLLGANLALLLLEQGHQVRCTRRPSSRVDHLAGHAIDWVEADLADEDSLARAFGGADAVFHCAAQLQLLRHPTPEQVDSNVEGTRRVLNAVRRAGAGRLVHCSSTVACAIAEGEGTVDEAAPWNLDRFGLDVGYAVTKRRAHELVLESASEVDAVVVCPGYMIGPCDVRPSSGKVLIELVRGKVPGYTDGCNSFVDVRDVARGMIAAHERGRRGESYILGGHNLPYKEFFERVAAVAGVRPPRRRVPRALAGLLGFWGDVQERLTGREALINSVRIRWAYCAGFRVRSDKAAAELGYRISPLEPAIADALAWFRERERNFIPNSSRSGAAPP